MKFCSLRLKSLEERDGDMILIEISSDIYIFNLRYINKIDKKSNF